MGSLRLKSERTLTLIWALSASLIPLMSIFGRNWQTYAALLFSAQQIGWIILSLLVAGVASTLGYHFRTIGPRLLWHLPWLIILFVGIPASLSIPVERLHFVTFGIYGFLSMRLFPLAIAIIACVSLSVGDEWLQWWLPNRVGEWRDVGLNALACCGGATYAIFVSIELDKKESQKTISK
jgi:hypothetical protein